MTKSMIQSQTESNLQSALHTKLVSLTENAAGFSASEITGYSPAQVRRAAEALVAAERIVRYRVGPRRIRYFGTLEQARAFSPERTAAVHVGLAGGPRMRANWKEGEPAIITSKTKITIAPRLAPDVYRTNTYLQF